MRALKRFPLIATIESVRNSNNIISSSRIAAVTTPWIGATRLTRASVQCNAMPFAAPPSPLLVPLLFSLRRGTACCARRRCLALNVPSSSQGKSSSRSFLLLVWPLLLPLPWPLPCPLPLPSPFPWPLPSFLPWPSPSPVRCHPEPQPRPLRVWVRDLLFLPSPLPLPLPFGSRVAILICAPIPNLIPHPLNPNHDKLQF